MTPQMFPETNAIMKGDPRTMPDVGELPVWTTKYEVAEEEPAEFVSCWKPSLWERLQILVSGRVWIHIHSFAHPPIHISGKRVYFTESTQSY